MVRREDGASAVVPPQGFFGTRQSPGTGRRQRSQPRRVLRRARQHLPGRLLQSRRPETKLLKTERGRGILQGMGRPAQGLRRPGRRDRGIGGQFSAGFQT